MDEKFDKNTPTITVGISTDKSLEMFSWRYTVHVPADKHY